MELKRKVTDTYSNKDFDYDQKLNSYINESPYLPLEKMENFPKYIPRQSLTKFLTRFKLFEMTKNIPGSIIECGVALGGGLMAFAQFSAILEPNNLSRKIIGFDTFDGFHSIDNIDRNQNNPSLFDELNYPDSEKDIRKSIELFDKNRFISHIPKVELVRGDATELIPQYLEKHPYLVISLIDCCNQKRTMTF